MSHYDCRKCGTYMCLGDCVGETESREDRARELATRQAGYVLNEEIDRRMKLQEARDSLVTLGTYDSEKYDWLFK